LGIEACTVSPHVKCGLELILSHRVLSMLPLRIKGDLIVV